MNTVEERVITEALVLMVPFKDLGISHEISKKCAAICCDKILENLLPFDSNTIIFYQKVRDRLNR